MEELRCRDVGELETLLGDVDRSWPIDIAKKTLSSTLQTKTLPLLVHGCLAPEFERPEWGGQYTTRNHV
jgi:hypothetical protein